MAARRLGGVGALLVALLGAAGLPSAGGCAPRPPEPQILRVWPEQDAARVYLRRVIASAEDVRRRGGLDALVGAIAGKRRQVLQRPTAAAVDDRDRLYVVDQENQGVHVFDLARGRADFFDRDGQDYFVSPVGAAWCDGRLAVSDSALNEVLLLTPAGKLERTIARPGGFARPTGLAFDPAHRELYVADTVASRISVFDLRGRLLREFGQLGGGPGQFSSPTHVHVGPGSTVYVSDSLNFRVQVLDRDGRFLRAIGEAGDASGHMALPKGLGVDSFGHLYVADSTLPAVQVFDGQGRFLLTIGGFGRGPGDFELPSGVAVRGNMIYICDFQLGRVQVFEYVGGETAAEQGAAPTTAPDQEDAR